MFNNQEPEEIFTHNMLYLRKERHWSQKETAKKLGIGFLTLRRIEKGILPKWFRSSKIFTISEVFDISVHDLFYTFLQ